MTYFKRYIHADKARELEGGGGDHWPLLTVETEVNGTQRAQMKGVLILPWLAPLACRVVPVQRFLFGSSSRPTLQIILDLCVPEKELAIIRSQI
jgi:hypothetical protein